MKLRQAIKIQRCIEEPERYDHRLRLKWKRETIWKSRTVCRRHDRYKKRRTTIPYIPSDDELEERSDWCMSIFADILIDDESVRDEFKEVLWSHDPDKMQAFAKKVEENPQYGRNPDVQAAGERNPDPPPSAPEA